MNSLAITTMTEVEAIPETMDLMPSRIGEQPQHQLQSDTSMSVLDRSINSLPMRQQQAFLFRHWEGLEFYESVNFLLWLENKQGKS